VTTATRPTSYCTVCDAEAGQCQHGAARYLDPIECEAVESGGWIVPENERARWEASPLRPEPQRVDEETKSLEVVVSELEALLFLDSPLEAKLRQVYELHPVRVSRLTTWMLEHAAGGSIRNPAGVLWKRLVELERRET
jgi:hypothetical protein